MKSKARVYLSGPISNNDSQIQEHNLQEFHRVAECLRSQDGYEVINPAEFSEQHPDLSYQSYIRADLRDMLTCNAVLMLDGYQESKGAMIEKRVAEMVGIEVFTDIRMLESWAGLYIAEMAELDKLGEEATSGSF
jgi:Domain of unknown function (DUF4406)